MATVTANNNPLKRGTFLDSSELLKMIEWFDMAANSVMENVQYRFK